MVNPCQKSTFKPRSIEYLSFLATSEQIVFLRSTYISIRPKLVNVFISSVKQVLENSWISILVFIYLVIILSLRKFFVDMQKSKKQK